MTSSPCSYTTNFHGAIPNLKTLSGRMEYAAAVLEEAGIAYQAYNPERFRWDALALRREAEHMRTRENEGEPL